MVADLPPSNSTTDTDINTISDLVTLDQPHFWFNRHTYKDGKNREYIFITIYKICVIMEKFKVRYHIIAGEDEENERAGQAPGEGGGQG